MSQVFKRYKYATKTFWGGLLDKKNPIGNIDEEASEWINSQLALCGDNAVLVSVNTEFIPPFTDKGMPYAQRVLVAICIGFND
ncbi:hypothetical protein EIM50_25720 [Pseudoxanthomonas sp. SGD-10]|nr:hypothetical protein EIM50_25720 [Pseudoxanthomonas sp. SGD-10]